MAPPLVYQSRNPACSTINFQNAALMTPRVPLIWVPITIGAVGDVLHVDASYLCSSRADPSQSYAGYASEYFSAAGLFLTASDLTGKTDVDLSTGIFIDRPDGGDAWALAGSSENPYCRHPRSAVYVATANDVGQRWLALMGWVTSANAGRWDYVLNETNECWLDVLRFPNS